MRARSLDWIALTCVIIGALNWGLLGFFGFDIAATMFGGSWGSFWFARTIYAIIGISGLYCLTLYNRIGEVHVTRD
jgi:uncharacterized membrane protein YuzA (DUF378 family)